MITASRHEEEKKKIDAVYGGHVRRGTEKKMKCQLLVDMIIQLAISIYQWHQGSDTRRMSLG